jgi:choline dehydrogenase-like flavoprotein
LRDRPESRFGPEESGNFLTAEAGEDHQEMVERRTIVVGSGPGGATVARELARAGEPVLLLERGRDWRRSRLYGTYLGALLYADKHALLYTSEGLNIVRPMMLGGATSMYCGCAAEPAAWWRDRYGIELQAESGETVAELAIAALPPELRGDVSTRIAEAGLGLGMPWHPQDKFMQPARSPDFDCGARCMLGCRCGAKWSAAEWVDDAVSAGAELWTEARVERVRISDGRVVGVAGTRQGTRFEVEAERVICAAGGIGSAVLLRESGLEAAGRGMTMDTTVMVYGHSPHRGQGNEPPMTWSCPDNDLGVLYSTLIDPWLMYPIAMAAKGPAYPLTWHRWGRTLGVMIKLKDEISGEVRADGTITKGITARDRERLSEAEQVAGRILRAAGCAPETVFTTSLRGTHPASTARIGEVVDHDLRTDVGGLYVCDASVFPEALCRPTVLTIIALAKRLASHLTGRFGRPPNDQRLDAIQR